MGNSSVRLHIGILLLLGAALFLWRLGSHDLWPPDEPRFAMQAWEMQARGTYHAPTLNGRANTEKEPLFLWAINAFAPLRGGVDEWAARLPSAVSTLGTLLLLYAMGALLYDRETGFYGALVFATCEQVLDQGRVASIDMLLTLLSLAAVLLLWHGATRDGDGRWETMLGWSAMGFATLAKGPVGLCVPLMAVVPALVLLRDRVALRRVFSPWGIFLYLLLALSWYIPLMLRIGAHDVRFGLIFNNVTRFLEATNFREPAWYYLWRLPVGFLPWIFFLPPAIRDAFRDRPSGDRRRAAIFLVSWSATLFLFFSAASGKRGVYILPIYPAISLLVGAMFARAVAAPEEAGRARPRLLVPAILWAVLGTLVGIALPVAAQRAYPSATAVAAAAGATVLGGALLAVVLLWRSRPRGAVAALAGSMSLLLLLVVEAFVPVVNERQNIRGFAEQLAPYLSADVPLAATKRKRDAWVFYLHRIVEEVDAPEEVRAYLAGPGPRDLIVEQATLDRLGDALPPGVQEVTAGQVGDERFFLLRRVPELGMRSAGG